MFDLAVIYLFSLFLLGLLLAIYDILCDYSWFKSNCNCQQKVCWGPLKSRTSCFQILIILIYLSIYLLIYYYFLYLGMAFFNIWIYLYLIKYYPVIYCISFVYWDFYSLFLFMMFDYCFLLYCFVFLSSKFGGIYLFWILKRMKWRTACCSRK